MTFWQDHFDYLFNSYTYLSDICKEYISHKQLSTKNEPSSTEEKLVGVGYILMGNSPGYIL